MGDVTDESSEMVDRIIEKKRWTPKRIMMIAGVTAIAAIIVYGAFLSGRGARLNVKSERIRIATVGRG